MPKKSSPCFCISLFYGFSRCFFSSSQWMWYPTTPVVLKCDHLLIWLSDSNSATFKTVVHGIIGGVPVPFPTANGDVNPPVPIQQNQKITYTNAIFVEPAYPKVLIQTQSVCSISQYQILLMFLFYERRKRSSTRVCILLFIFQMNEKQA